MPDQNTASNYVNDTLVIGMSDLGRLRREGAQRQRRNAHPAPFALDAHRFLPLGTRSPRPAYRPVAMGHILVIAGS